MSLEKDPSIIDFVANLRAEPGEAAVHVVDHWAADLCAIGLAASSDHEVLAYVSTCGMLPGRVAVHLELPGWPGSALPYVDAGVYEHVGSAEAVEIIRAHFRRAG